MCRCYESVACYESKRSLLCLEVFDKILVFAVLKHCLLQQRKTEASCVL